MNKAEILANCIEEIRSGRSTIEGCLSRYPGLRDELCPLLKIALNIRPPQVTMSPEFRQKARLHLLQIMQPAATERRGWNRWGWLTPSLSTRALSLVLAGIMVVWLLATAGGTVYASQGSLPGDVLYPVKTGLENLQLAITQKPQDKADLYLKLAERRAEEAVAESQVKGTVSPVTLDGVANEIDNAVKAMGGAAPENARAFASKLAESTLQQQMALGQALEKAPTVAQPALQKALEHARRGNVIAQAAYGNPVFLSRNPSVREKDLEDGRFTIQGSIESVDGQTWNVGGIILGNVTSGESMSAGTTVKLEGISRDNQVYIFKVEHDGETEDKVKIDGIFKGKDKEGTTWNVSGITVGVADNQTMPSRGEKLEVSGAGKDGTVSKAQVQSKEDDKEKKRAVVEGTLAEVNAKQKTITANNAGALVKINIDEASITTSDGQKLSLSDLSALMGRGIKVEGVYRKGNTMYAGEVHVNVFRTQSGQSGRQTPTETQDKDKDKDKNPGSEPKSDSQNKSKDSRDNQGKDSERDGRDSQNRDSQRRD